MKTFLLLPLYKGGRVTLLLLLIFTACHPVKRVLQDPVKFEQVAQEVVRRGYCVNDTTVRDTVRQVIRKDSLVRDTLFLSLSPSAPFSALDTLLPSGARVVVLPGGQMTVSCPVKEVREVVTVEHMIRDRKKENLLQQDIDQRDQLLNQQRWSHQQLEERYHAQQQQLTTVKKQVRNKTLQLYGLLAALLLLIGLRIVKTIRSFLPL